MRTIEAIAKLQREAKTFGYIVWYEPKDGTLQLYRPTGATTLTAIRQALRAARRSQKRAKNRRPGPRTGQTG